MLVDDDAAVRQVGEHMLRRLGFAPTVFENPVAALQDFHRHPDRYCAVVTDLTMPGMTGVDLAAELARIRSGVPLLLASGYVNKLAEQASWTAEVKHIIRKPFALEELAAQLRVALDEPAA
jgi:CheY-like chemotaxis protein